jgi:hypothetical protein
MVGETRRVSEGPVHWEIRDDRKRFFCSRLAEGRGLGDAVDNLLLLIAAGYMLEQLFDSTVSSD